MKVYVLVLKSNPHADYGEVFKVYATKAKAEHYADFLNKIGNYTEIVESELLGE